MRRIKKGDWVYCTKPMKDFLREFPPYHPFLVTRPENMRDGRFCICISGRTDTHYCISKRWEDIEGEKDCYLQEGDYWRVVNFEENLKKILE